jgi:hypothetical protein
MYHPQEIDAALQISLHIEGSTFHVEHNYRPSAVREMFFESKINRVLKPLLQELKSRDLLLPTWEQYLRSALLCCPLLTMNLNDRGRFPASVGLLGLCYVVEMAGHGSTESMLDRALQSAI